MHFKTFYLQNLLYIKKEFCLIKKNRNIILKMKLGDFCIACSALGSPVAQILNARLHQVTREAK